MKHYLSQVIDIIKLMRYQLEAMIKSFQQIEILIKKKETEKEEIPPLSPTPPITNKEERDKERKINHYSYNINIKTKKKENTTPLRKTTVLQDSLINRDQNFDMFWRIYPHKKSQVQARRYFDKLAGNFGGEFIQRLAAVLREYLIFREKNPSCVIYPSTFINNAMREHPEELWMKKEVLK